MDLLFLGWSIGLVGSMSRMTTSLVDRNSRKSLSSWMEVSPLSLLIWSLSRSWTKKESLMHLWWRSWTNLPKRRLHVINVCSSNNFQPAYLRFQRSSRCRIRRREGGMSYLHILKNRLDKLFRIVLNYSELHRIVIVYEKPLFFTLCFV